MFSDRKTSTQALLEAGPSSGSPQPTSVESHLKDVVVDNPSNVLQASTLSSRIPKPRPLSVADDFEIVGGVPAFVWRRPQDDNPNYRIFAISFDGSRIAIKEGRHRICIYDMLDNFSLVAEWEDSSRENIEELTFHNNQNNELVVVFRDSTVALMHIKIKDEYAMEELKSSQPQFERMKINAEFRILDEYGNINQLLPFIANEGCETWVVMLDYNASNTITMLSIIQNKFQRLKIESTNYITPMHSYCSITQKALLLVHTTGNECTPLRTRFVHDIGFTKEVIDYSARSIEDGQSFGFSECGNYFLIWRHNQGGEDALELYEIQSLKQSLDPIARKSLGHGVVQVRANFIKSTSAAIELFKLDVQDIPIVAFIVVRVNQLKLMIWEPKTNAILKEIDLTMKEMTFSQPIHVEFCISPNLKWVAIGCWSDGIFGLFSMLSGMQIWNVKLNTSVRLIHTFIPLKFDLSSTRLIINACDTLYVVCPPSLVEDYCLEFQSATYDIVKDFEEQIIPLKLGHHLLIPKHILTQMLVLKYELESHDIREVLDIARSNITPTIALLVCKNDVLSVFLGPYEVFFKSSFQKCIGSKWSKDSLPSSVSELKVENLPIKQSQFSNEHQTAWIFLHSNEERNRDLVVVFLSQESLQGVFIDLVDMQSQERVSFLAQACFAIKQTKDGSKVSSLHASGVMVIDLNQRVVLCDVCYQVNLSQWLVPYIKNRGEDCFGVLSDGDTILLGWDTKNDNMLTLTKEMAEDEFKMMFEDEESITPIHLFGDFCKAFAFLEFNEDNQEVLSICVHNIKGNSTKRITREQWNPQITRVLDSMTHEDLQKCTLSFDENNGQLWIIGLKQRDTTCHLILIPINPYSIEGCIPSLYMRNYPRREVVEINE
eukprot:g7404.t2